MLGHHVMTLITTDKTKGKGRCGLSPSFLTGTSSTGTFNYFSLMR